VAGVSLWPDGEGDTQEDEVLGRGEDLGLHQKVCELEVRAVDTEVGDAWRVCEAEGDLDSAAGAGDGLGSGVIVLGDKVGIRV
jgi:hypothetical protein